MSRKLSKKRDARKPSGKSFKKAHAIAKRAARKVVKIVNRAVGKAAKLGFHPYSMLLPMMAPSEREALKADIAANGLREKIMLLDGQILDGRNRYEICIELGIQPLFETFDPKIHGEPLAYVYSRAMHRNLTDSQKACAAVHFDAKFSEQAKARALANLKQNADEKHPWPAGAELEVKYRSMSEPERVLVIEYKDDLVTLEAAPGHKRAGDRLTMPVDNVKSLNPQVIAIRSRDRAAALFGVSGRYVQQAKLLLSHDKKLFEEVFNGQLALTKATRSIHRKKKSNDLEKRAAGVELSFPLGLIVGDCVKEMEKMKAGSFRLGFADSPYNLGIDYGTGAKADLLPVQKYYEWCGEWIGELHRVLTKDGTLWVLINDEHAAKFKLMLEDAGFTVRAWIKWYETFGVNCTKNFNRTSRHLFYCVKDPDNFTFHAKAFNRQSDRQKKYGDSRANPAGKTWDDVWCDIPRLVDNAKERVPGFPTQLPLALLLPIIEGTSDKGDAVIDPFNGSGTTAHAAMLTGRVPTTIDIVKRNIEWTEKRLKAAIADQPAIADSHAQALKGKDSK